MHAHVYDCSARPKNGCRDQKAFLPASSSYSFTARNGTTAFVIRASALFLNSGREPFTFRYRRRTQTAGGGPTS